MATLRHTFHLAFGLLGLTSLANAAPTEEQLMQLNSRVLRVQADLANGGVGLGSGVVVAKDQVATSCHVIANAGRVNLVSKGNNYNVSMIRADWKHDVCILRATGLDVPAVKITASRLLKYEQPVFTIGYPGLTIRPVNTYGNVKGLYRMDDGLVIRTSSPIKIGASGGGLFDENGNLAGLITVKSPGPIAYYYNVSTEWIQSALKLPEQPVSGEGELPFWAQAPEKWPYFMKIVHPYLTEDWVALQKIAKQWAEQEPGTADAWFYLAAAEYATKDTQLATTHLQKVLAMNKQHGEANYYLNLIAQENSLSAATKVARTSKAGKPVGGKIELVVARQ